MSLQHLLNTIDPMSKEDAISHLRRVLDRCEEMIFHWQGLMNSTQFGSRIYTIAYHCYQIDRDNITQLKQLIKEIENEGI